MKELQFHWDAWNKSYVQPISGSTHTDFDGYGPGAKPPAKSKSAKRRD